MGMQRSANSNRYFEKESGSPALSMSKEELVGKIKKILKRDVELTFLFNLDLEDLRILLASLRDLIDREMQRI
jgi:hypothetical protein